MKQEIQKLAEEKNKLQTMYEEINFSKEKEKNELQPKIQELNDQLEEYVEAYKVLEEKYKETLKQKEEEIPVVVHSQTPTPVKKESIIKKPEDAKIIERPREIDPALGELKKKVSEDVEAKKALRELIRVREDTIKKQKEVIDNCQKQLEANKSEMQYMQSQLSQKNTQVKSLTAKINDLSQDLQKFKQLDEEKKSKPKTGADLVKQKIKGDKLEKVEAKPYLFGPRMDDNQY